MSGAPTPPVIPEAFAAQADPGFVNTIPDTTADPQRASWELGWPPQTMTPIIAGGKPMLGPDMNGVLFALSSHTIYQQTGQPYRYNSEVATSIGGYVAGTVLGMADGSGLWLNLVNGNTTDPDASGAGWLSLSSYGITPVVSTGGAVTLTAVQAAKSIIVVSGALVANLQVVLPAQVRSWLIINSTSGSFGLTVRTPAGSGVNVPQGGFGAPVEVYGDGTNLYPTVAPFTLPGDVAPTPNTYVVRSSLGDIYGRALITGVTRENLLMTSVYFEYNSDGIIRKISPANFQAQLALSGFAGQVTAGQVPQAAVTQYAAAILANAALTGVPTAPTATPGTSNTQVATTAFVAGTVSRANPGYERYPNGSIRQFGSHVFGDLVTGFGNNVFNVTFATPFPNGITSVTFGRTGDCRAANAFGRFFSNAGFQLGMEETVSVTQGADNTATWEVWGY